MTASGIRWDARGAGHSFQCTYLTEVSVRWQPTGEQSNSLNLQVAPGVNAPLTLAGGTTGGQSSIKSISPGKDWGQRLGLCMFVGGLESISCPTH